MSYTKGPWKLQAGRSFETSDGTFYLSYGKDKHGNPNFRDFCALDANAHLIAAAPELLEASDRALEYFYRLQEEGADGFDSVIEALEKAIAKAEGKD